VPGYVVVARLSQGGRFETYDVYSPERDCRCILKTVRADRGDQESGRAALLREGMLLRDLTHPHLVRAYEVLETPRAAVVTEILTGATLAALIEEHGPLSTADTVLLGLHLTSVLGYLHHHGWLHLDVKPSNVVVQAGRAVLIDLGIVARPGDGRPHAGTWGYMAPEQSTGRAPHPGDRRLRPRHHPRRGADRLSPVRRGGALAQAPRQGSRAIVPAPAESGARVAGRPRRGLRQDRPRPAPCPRRRARHAHRLPERPRQVTVPAGSTRRVRTPVHEPHALPGARGSVRRGPTRTVPAGRPSAGDTPSRAVSRSATRRACAAGIRCTRRSRSTPGRSPGPTPD
jgi:hypothetical protein